MESIAELRQMLQADKLVERKNIWGYYPLRRGLSIYITRFLIPTRVKPIHMTVLVLVCGVGGSLMMLGTSPWLNFSGLILLYLNVVFDAVDGELARYKKVFSLRDIFLDLVNHAAVPALFLAAMALQVSHVTHLQPEIVLYLGILGALSLALQRSIRDFAAHLYLNPYREHRELYRLSQPSPSPMAGVKAGPIGTPLYFMHQFRHFVIMLVIFFVAYLVEYFFYDYVTHPIVSILVVFYSLLLTAYLVREVIGGFYAIESRVSEIESRLGKH